MGIPRLNLSHIFVTMCTDKNRERPHGWLPTRRSPKNLYAEFLCRVTLSYPNGWVSSSTNIACIDILGAPQRPYRDACGAFVLLPLNYGGADDMARTNGGTRKNLMRTTGDPHQYRMDARLTAQEYNDLLRCSEAAGTPGNVSRGVRWALARATEILHAAGQIAPAYGQPFERGIED